MSIEYKQINHAYFSANKATIAHILTQSQNMGDDYASKYIQELSNNSNLRATTVEENGELIGLLAYKKIGLEDTEFNRLFKPLEIFSHLDYIGSVKSPKYEDKFL